MGRDKNLISEAVAVRKLLKGILAATNAQLPIKEKVDTFFQKLINNLEGTDDIKADHLGWENDGLHNTIPSTDRNLEFLATKFAGKPTDRQKANLEEKIEKDIKKIIKETLETS